MAKIPTRLEELLPLGAYEKVVDLLHRPDLSGRLREALGKLGVKDLNPLDQVQEAWQQAKTWLGSFAEAGSSGSPHWINATGSLFSADMDRVPMIPSASLSLARTMSQFQDRQGQATRVTETMDRLFSGKSYAWLADSVSALQFASRCLGKTALIARCDCNRIPGFGDVRAMLAGFGNSVVEVGATNGATESDWLVELSNHTQPVVFMVSPSSLAKDQYQDHRTAALSAAKNRGAKVVELSIDATCHGKLASSLGFPAMSNDRFTNEGSAVDLLLLPTHLLIGGTRGMLAVGDTAIIQSIEANASVLGASMDAASISANLLALQLNSLEGEMDCGVVSNLIANPDNLKNRCQRLAIQLAGVGPIKTAQVIDSQHPLGASPWDQYKLQNAVIVIESASDISQVQQGFGAASPDRPSIRVRRLDNRLIVDLRFVQPEDDHHIATAAKNL